MDQVVELRGAQHRVADAGGFQRLFDAKLGPVVGQRDPIDADDRDMDDVRDAGPRAAVTRFCMEVTSLSRVPWVAQCTITSTPSTAASTPVPARRSACTPVHAGVADVATPTHRPYPMTGGRGRADHLSAQRAGRSGDENVAPHGCVADVGVRCPGDAAMPKRFQPRARWSTNRTPIACLRGPGGQPFRAESPQSSAQRSLSMLYVIELIEKKVAL